MAITVLKTEEIKEVVDSFISKLNQELWKVNHEVRAPAYSESTTTGLTSTDLV
jgi:hypothetical protein